MAPQKVRRVIDIVRGRPVEEALALLRFTPNAAAKPTYKLIASAAANAEEVYGLVRDELYVAEIMAGPGATRKKGRFGARGRFKPELARSCHISVALREINPEQLPGVASDAAAEA
jgi:large subunit ribosomal protein L22